MLYVPQKMLLLIYGIGTKKFVMNATQQNKPYINSVNARINNIDFMVLFIFLLIFLLPMNIAPLLMSH